jgi:hypothetical protein
MADSSGRTVHRTWLAFLIGGLVGALLTISVPLLTMQAATDAPLVDARLPLRSEGLVVPFTLSAPGRVTIHVELPAMLESDVAVGPLYVALRPHLVLEPEEREDRTHAINGCQTAAFTETFKKPGAYALRIPPIPTAMGMESEMFANVRITVVGE